MTKGMRYVAPVALLLISLAGACLCGHYVVYGPNMLLRVTSVIGTMGWLILLTASVIAIRKGWRM